MIYSYGARNYFSFKEGLNASFQLTAKAPALVSQGRKVATVLGIKGGNASGKTSILKCLRFLSWFIADSFANDEKDNISLDPYFDNKNPTDFYIDFQIGDAKYRYELTATREAVVREALYKKLQRKTLIVERKGDAISYRSNEYSALDLIELKTRASFVSTIVKYKIKNLPSDFERIVSYFERFAGNVTPLGLIPDSEMFNRESATSFYNSVPEAFEFVKNFIRRADLGIVDIEIHSHDLPTGKKEFFPIFIHKVGKSNGRAALTSYDQSSGTMALYRRLAIYWMVLKEGGVLIMDEFDQNCHPMLLPPLLDLFINKESNPHGAQFLFTAHNSDVIDSLGKYRTILVSKEDGESYSYRLDEIPGDLIRNDRSISALYREGKLGGIPKL
ncbi:ATP-binding protein [Pseudomonas sp. p1(2021b)]|uniref:AAA family ATPase n=1 Tax=Pseudomonas sp. p1(2021b) TaxID=2874628 RepID=UPI001CC9D1BE|nr:ATP-binding protein [Pseudomonas sp. p1(2021b)]UBM24309.1 ATP-binding protein [Pseudomonas sp. p1(2021b)]